MTYIRLAILNFVFIEPFVVNTNVVFDFDADLFHSEKFWPSRLIFAPCIFVNNPVIFFSRFFPHFSFQNVRELLGRILWENNMRDRDMYTIWEQ